MSSLGFTGSQEFTGSSAETQHLDRCLRDLIQRYNPDTVVTGACIGFDAAIHHWFEANLSHITRRVIVPANRSKVAIGVMGDPGAKFVMMPPGTSYRDRNEQIVESSDHMAAFWTGRRAYSGTYMTINIAAKAGKLNVNDIFGAGILSDDEARYLYANGDP